MQNALKMELNAALAQLIAQREQWEHGVYKQANTELYAILEQCAEIYARLKNDKAHARMFNAVTHELDIKFNKGTSLALKIVRVVFGQESNREFAYARVLKTWFDQSDPEQTLTSFVIECGGIENVRRGKSSKAPNKLSAADYRDIAASALTGDHSLGSFALQNYMLSDSENDTDYLVALVHSDGNGSGKIVYGSNQRALVNTVLSVVGKELDERQKHIESKTTLHEVKQRKVEDMKEFVARTISGKAAA